MLKLIYDVRCGFKELYLTEKDCAWDFTEQLKILQEEWDLDTPAPTEEQLFEQYKTTPELLLEEVFEGVDQCIESVITEEYGHTYFKHICFEDKEHTFLPGYFKMYNLRLVREATVELDCAGLSKESIKESLYKIKAKIEDGLKAEDVMAILGISRQTLSNWVKRGLIEAKKTATGRYIYDAESVYALKKLYE